MVDPVAAEAAVDVAAAAPVAVRLAVPRVVAAAGRAAAAGAPPDPDAPPPQAAAGGAAVAEPGTYRVKITANGKSLTSTLTVRADPGK